MAFAMVADSPVVYLIIPQIRALLNCTERQISKSGDTVGPKANRQVAVRDSQCSVHVQLTSNPRIMAIECTSSFHIPTDDSDNDVSAAKMSELQRHKGPSMQLISNTACSHSFCTISSFFPSGAAACSGTL